MKTAEDVEDRACGRNALQRHRWDIETRGPSTRPRSASLHSGSLRMTGRFCVYRPSPDGAAALGLERAAALGSDGAAAALVSGDDAILDVNHAMRIFGDVVFVGDQDNGVALLVQAIEQRHDLGTGGGI